MIRSWKIFSTNKVIPPPTKKRTVLSCDDLRKLGQENPNIDEEFNQEVVRFNSDVKAASQAWINLHLQSVDYTQDRTLKQVIAGIAVYRQ